MNVYALFLGYQQAGAKLFFWDISKLVQSRGTVQVGSTVLGTLRAALQAPMFVAHQPPVPPVEAPEQACRPLL